MFVCTDTFFINILFSAHILLPHTYYSNTTTRAIITRVRKHSVCGDIVCVRRYSVCAEIKYVRKTCNQPNGYFSYLLYKLKFLDLILMIIRRSVMLTNNSIKILNKYIFNKKSVE